MIRVLDFLAAFLGLLLLWPILFLVTLIGMLDTGSPIFIQERVGRHKKPFKLIKFRTMLVETESVASHLADQESITKVGRFLRKTKLDELPQLINVIRGQMSLVGPRPNLYNQEEVIQERELLGVYDVLPGITGLAQIQSIDMSQPQQLAEIDKRMIESMSLHNYFRYVFLTVFGKGTGDAARPR